MMRKSIVRQRWIVAPFLSGALGVSACAPAQPPVASLSRAEVAVRQASDSNASRYAPLELQAAREKLAEARLAFETREYERAHRLAEQALANARLAEARAEVESSRQTARDLRLTIEALRDEVARASTAPVYLSPSVPRELQLAREKLAEARLAFEAWEYERARRLAEQALADARVAEVRAETESTRQTARDLHLSSGVLRDEAARLAALY